MNQGKHRTILGFLAVPVVLYSVFVISPYLQAFSISLTDWKGFSGAPHFVGISNYLQLFKDPVFLSALSHNVAILIFLPITTIALALFFAFMLNAGGKRSQKGVNGSSVYRVVYFFPYVLSVAIVGILWSNVYNPINGLLNSFAQLFGIPVSRLPTWLGDPDLALGAIVTVMVWSGVGFYVVLFTAAMQSVPSEIYEAAVLDGASGIRTFASVTVPLIWDNVQTAVVYLGIAALDGFAIVFIMTPSGGPNGSTQLVSTYLYQNAFKYGQFGYAAAMGVVLFLVTLGLAALTMRLTRRESVEF